MSVLSSVPQRMEDSSGLTLLETNNAMSKDPQKEEQVWMVVFLEMWLVELLNHQVQGQKQTNKKKSS